MRRLLASLVLWSALPGSAAAQACRPIALPAGVSSGELVAEAPAEEVLCYVLDMGPHDDVLRLRITGRNVAFSWQDDHGGQDAQTDSFVGPSPGLVEVRVFQLFRSVTPETFTLRVDLEPPGNG